MSTNDMQKSIWKVFVNGFFVFRFEAFTKKAVRHEAKRRYPDAADIVVELV